MESNYSIFRIIVIVTVSTLVTIFITPVDSTDSFIAARSLLSEPESPAPEPDFMSPISSPANSPTEVETESPVPAPEALVDSISPASSPTEMENDYAVEAPSESNSLADAPAEEDKESPAPAPSPEAPADSPAYSPSQENPDASSPTGPSGLNLLSTAKNLLNPELKTICRETDNPVLCESSVSPLLTAQFKLDVSSVLVLEIEASVNATKAALETVKKLAVADCQELFDDAVTNLEDAVKAVKSRDSGTLNTNLSAAMTDYGKCNDGFEDSGEPNPLGDLSDKLTKMVSNCLALSTLIK